MTLIAPDRRSLAVSNASTALSSGNLWVTIVSARSGRAARTRAASTNSRVPRRHPASKGVLEARVDRLPRQSFRSCPPHRPRRRSPRSARRHRAGAQALSGRLLVRMACDHIERAAQIPQHGGRCRAHAAGTDHQRSDGGTGAPSAALDVWPERYNTRCAPVTSMP